MRNLLVDGSAEPFRQIVAACAEAVIGMDASHKIVIFNSAAETMFGLPWEDAIGQSISILIPEEFRALHSNHVEKFRVSGRESRYMGDRKNFLKALRSDGSIFPAAATIMSLKTEDGPLMVAHLRDISVRMAMVEEQTILASMDPLTNALNRRGFLDEAKIFENKNPEKMKGYALLMMDLDNFKTVNDKYGHGAGDEILRDFSMVCKATLRENDIFARWGGEEFVAMLPVMDIDAGIEIAERIRLRTATHPFKVLKHTILRQTVSIGVVYSSDRRDDLTDMISRADKALYAAKTGGRNCVRSSDIKFAPQQRKTA